MTFAPPREAAPFAPRELSRSEKVRSDLYLFYSPKLRRPVTVARPAALALAMEHEFAPHLVHYVERPRYLSFEDGRIELSFWTIDRDRREQYLWLTLPAPKKTGPSTRGAQRRLDAILSAAKNAQMALRTVTEVEVARQGLVNTNRLRLLPWVQTAMDLPQADALAPRLLERFAFQPRLSFVQLEHAFAEFDARDVRAVTASLIHCGALRLDWNSRLHGHSLLEREARS